MAHAASALKKNRDVDVNAIEDEKEKKRRIKKLASREQKRKVLSLERDSRLSHIPIVFIWAAHTHTHTCSMCVFECVLECV